MNIQKAFLHLNIFILVITGIYFIGYEINYVARSKRVSSKRLSQKMMVIQRKSKNEFQLNFITKHGPENLTRYQKLPEAIIIGEAKCGEYRNITQKYFILNFYNTKGTGTLVEFLQINPNIIFAQKEIWFFDVKYYKGIAWYMCVLIY
jgi:hypothetical protein